MSWYEHPAVYDLAFRSETRIEADFILAACRKYCPFPARRLLEPGCGSGRLVVELAQRGCRMVGFDLSEPALDYLRRRLQRRRLKADVFSADMADFVLKRRVDAAFCTFNTFRHLLTEKTARAHLQCVAQALRPGGIYILGLHLLPMDVAEDDIERWSEQAGRTRVTVTLRVLHMDRRRRLERLRVSVCARSPSRQLRFRDEFLLRLYTARQFTRLLKAVSEFELCDVYDFWYEIDRPQKLDDIRTDTLFILRKRRGRVTPLGREGP